MEKQNKLTWRTFNEWKKVGMVVRLGQKGTKRGDEWVFSNEQVTKYETPSERYERQAVEEGQILLRSIMKYGAQIKF